MTRGAARVTAHAKINLGLRILAREAGGYHSIETVFARIALGDVVTVRVGGAGRSLDCVGGDAGPVERNLAWRAAVAYAEATRWPAGFAIEIEKCVPVGGGLGGGSADAGAVLRALAALAPRAPSEGELLRLAMSLGSDVPYLTTEAPLALAWGRGERMLALPSLPARHVALVVPDFAVSTADAYAWLAASRGAWSPEPALFGAATFASWETLAPCVTNDFEEPVGYRHPELAPIVREVRRAGARIACMSGSGSTVFGIFDAPPDAAALEGRLPGTRVVATTTLERVTGVERIE
ncbi:MAG TPA: 4-(cytidine 5'-diphospho)-2-C-methyl-D-erythritol kinase [Gemmatimonadaceae bacterium]